MLTLLSKRIYKTRLRVCVCVDLFERVRVYIHIDPIYSNTTQIDNIIRNRSQSKSASFMSVLLWNSHI